MSKLDFVHLHVHSHYSLLDGLGKVDEIIAKAKELDQKAIALTDHGAMYGTIDFYLSAKKAGIKPIIGQEIYVSRRKLTDRTVGIDTKPYHLVLLAKNYQGYLNLIKLTSLANLEGYYYKPRVDRDTLSRYSEGLIATTACLASETSQLILNNETDTLKRTIEEYREIFGKDHYYLELQHHPSIPEQQVVNERIKALASSHKLPMIITNDVHYINAEDRIAHDLLVCIQTGKFVSDTDRMIYKGDFSLKSAQEIFNAFPDLPDALDNTVKIAQMTDLEIPMGSHHLPKFPLPPNETEESLLKKWCEKGLTERYQNITTEIRERLEYELSIVNKMGFPGYFLIVADFIKFAREKGIYVGPGRGSAAGSLIAYAIKITNIDPILNGLMFERFLDLNRISMPDIDVDFEDTRRKEVIDYVREKYGDNHVAGIITFGTIMARAAVRDSGRVLGMPYNKVDQIAKLIPATVQGRHTPLKQSIQDVPELKQVYTQEPEVKQLLDAATSLEGTIRHASQHACAIVISKNPLDQYVAVQQAQGGDVHQVTQYSMDPIDNIGLLKMDILGLANLTTMHKAIDIISAVYGDEVDIDKIPNDDKKTFQLLARGETVGVFQLESAGMKRYIKELKPNKFQDIVAIVALYRPGPIQWIDSFINRKNNREEVEYLHPLAEKSMKDTYGIPVYQEQVMQMSKDMCGFTGAEADTLRKAIGKKIPKLMAEIKEKFISGAVNNGVDKKQASQIWTQLEDFAAYCFNKSHATCYAVVAYQTAYLKAHYPDCFMAALMTSDLDDIDRLSIEISESERMGIKVLPPDVNESFADFAVVKDKKSIRFGIGAIKNVGATVAKSIVKERKQNGVYNTLEEFLSRLGPVLNKKVLESLVKAGALDCFSSREKLWAGVELLVKYASGGNGKGAFGQTSLFQEDEQKSMFAKIVLPESSIDTKEFLTWEKELLGLYLSDHPLKKYTQILEKNTTSIDTITVSDANKTLRVGGMVKEHKKIVTKSNQTMAFVTLEDTTGEIEVITFPTIYNERPEIWQVDQMIVVQGKVSDKDNTPKILADRVWPLTMAEQNLLPPLNSTDNGSARTWPNKKDSQSQTQALSNSKIFVIELPKNTTKENLTQLKEILESYPGTTPVELRLLHKSEVKIIPTKITISETAELNQAISQITSIKN